MILLSFIFLLLYDYAILLLLLHLIMLYMLLMKMMMIMMMMMLLMSRFAIITHRFKILNFIFLRILHTLFLNISM